MAHLSYQVGIDLGTTYSAAAVCRTGDPRPQAVALGGLTASVASMVFLAPDGSMLCGEAAHRRALTDPRRVVREFKRRIGDGTPLVVGGSPVAAEDVAARFVAWILERVAEQEAGPAERVALTHPAGWGPHKRESLTEALAAHGVHDVQFLAEPEAAAIGYASSERIDDGAVVAVYDFGGGTFDAAVVRKLPDGGFAVLGEPVGIERLGGIDLDEVVFDHVREAVGEAWQRLDPTDPAVQTAVAGLRRECTAAKEALSADTEVMVPVMLPGHHAQVRLGRTEFEEYIRPAVAETVETLRRAVESAGAPALDAVLMVGGSSRIPLVAQLVSAELGTAVAVDTDPRSIIAAGAAVAARGPLAPVPGPVAVTMSAVPPCPPLDLEPPLGAPEPVVARPRRLRTLAVAAGLGVVASLGVGAATLAPGVETTSLAGTGTGTAAAAAAHRRSPPPRPGSSTPGRAPRRPTRPWRDRCGPTPWPPRAGPPPGSPPPVHGAPPRRARSPPQAPSPSWRRPPRRPRGPRSWRRLRWWRARSARLPTQPPARPPARPPTHPPPSPPARPPTQPPASPPTRPPSTAPQPARRPARRAAAPQPARRPTRRPAAHLRQRVPARHLRRAGAHTVTHRAEDRIERPSPRDRAATLYR